MKAIASLLMLLTLFCAKSFAQEGAAPLSHELILNMTQDTVMSMEQIVKCKERGNKDQTINCLFNEDTAPCNIALFHDAITIVGHEEIDPEVRVLYLISKTFGKAAVRVCRALSVLNNISYMNPQSINEYNFCDENIEELQEINELILNSTNMLEADLFMASGADRFRMVFESLRVTGTEANGAVCRKQQ